MTDSSKLLIALDTIYEYERSIKRPEESLWVDEELRHDPFLLSPQATEMYMSYSWKCLDYLRFGYEVDACLSGNLSIYTDVMVSKATPSIFQRCGFTNLPILHTQAHVRDEPAPKDDYKHHHGLSLEQLKGLPEKLEDPIMIFDAPSRRNRYNEIVDEGRGVVAVLDCFDCDGVPLTAYFSPNGHGQYKTLNIASNFLTSIYGRRNLIGFVNRAAEEDKILYVDPAKFEDMKKDSLRFDEPQCSPAIENLFYRVRQSKQIVNRDMASEQPELDAMVASDLREISRRIGENSTRGLSRASLAVDGLQMKEGDYHGTFRKPHASRLKRDVPTTMPPSGAP